MNFFHKENRHWFEIAADGFLAQWRDCFRGVASSRYCEFQTLVSPGRQCWKSKPRRLDNREDFVAQVGRCDWPVMQLAIERRPPEIHRVSPVPGQRSHASCRPGSARRSGQGRATTDQYGGDNQRRCVPLHARTKSRQDDGASSISTAQRLRASVLIMRRVTPPAYRRAHFSHASCPQR